MDLTGLEVDALQITGKNALTLKGGKTLNMNLTINGVPGISFSGIEEVQNVSVSNMPATTTGRGRIQLPRIKENRDFVGESGIWCQPGCASFS